MARSDDLAGASADERARRERRTAVSAALREAMRNGTGTPPASVLDALQERRDGTQMTATQRPDLPNLAGQGNHADHITHSFHSVED